MSIVNHIRGALYGALAFEISKFTRFYDGVIHYHPLPADRGELLREIKCKRIEVIPDGQFLPSLSANNTERIVILINGNFNHSYNIHGILKELKPKLSRFTRLCVVAYNPYLKTIYAFLTFMGIRKAPMPTTFLTMADVRNMVKLDGYEIVKSKSVGLVPFNFFGLGRMIESILSMFSFLRCFSFMHILVLRPICKESEKFPSLSIIIPARNEKGNIENAILRMPDFGGKLEIIFVEGHSTDGTWDEILRVKEKYQSEKIQIKAYKQVGVGKNDSVRLGFSNATCELLTILDADLTMPPEDLPRFYDTFRSGHADFINGSRLVYPMEGEAMRTLNHLGNVFFAKALSLILGASIGDSLCGTKLLARHDYQRFVNWRREFGEFDPFGDFELLFPAVILGLGIVDIPVRYRARTYGSTNISRFRHGWMLLKMTLMGFFRVRLAGS